MKCVTLETYEFKFGIIMRYKTSSNLNSKELRKSAFEEAINFKWLLWKKACMRVTVESLYESDQWIKMDNIYNNWIR